MQSKQRLEAELRAWYQATIYLLTQLGNGSNLLSLEAKFRMLDAIQKELPAVRRKVLLTHNLPEPGGTDNGPKAS